MRSDEKAVSAQAVPAVMHTLLHRVLEQTLNKSALLKQVPASTLKTLEREFRVESYAAREVIFFEGQGRDCVLLMLRGLATMTYLDSRHRRILFEIVGPGDVCGDGAFLPNPLRDRLRCDAVRGCVMASVEYRRLVELLFGIPFGRFDAGFSFIEATRNRYFARGMLARGKSLRERLLELVMDLGERFGVSDSRGLILDLPLTHEDLADLVDASRPKVTREIGWLEAEGIIVRQGRGRFLIKRPP